LWNEFLWVEVTDVDFLDDEMPVAINPSVRMFLVLGVDVIPYDVAVDVDSYSLFVPLLGSMSNDCWYTPRVGCVAMKAVLLKNRLDGLADVAEWSVWVLAGCWLGAG
jgi:hypothetical protein